PGAGGSAGAIEAVPGGRARARPGDAEQHRGAPRLRRGGRSGGGVGGPSEAPGTPSNSEERHGYAGALRALGGLGGPSRPPMSSNNPARRGAGRDAGRLP